ncbi:MAG: pentapeptide repeat-containing protein [Sulfitobacter sp.]
MNWITIELPAPLVVFCGIALASVLISLVPLSRFTGKPAPLLAIQDKMGLGGLNSGLFFLILLFWVTLFLLLFGGLLGTIYALLDAPIPKANQTDDIWSWRFSVLKLASLTAVLGAVVALPFTLMNLALTRRQTEATETGLVTDRLNTAVSSLASFRETSRIGRPVTYYSDAVKSNETEIEWRGEPFILDEFEHITETASWQSFPETGPSIEIRIGGIFALERIARENPAYHFQVIEILCAYIRGNVPTQNLEPSLVLGSFKRKKPREDIQIAITVLGRRSDEGKKLETVNKFRLDLRGCDLSGADFSNGDYDGCILAECRLEGSRFTKSSLRGAWFFGSLLNFADFWQADMTGSRLDRSIINRPSPHIGGMNSTLNMAAKIIGISVAGANLTAVDYFGEPDEMNKTFGTKDTRLAEDLEEIREGLELRKLKAQIRKARRAKDRTLTMQLEKRLEESGFANWSPHDRSDMSTGMLYRELLDQLSLTAFPFLD